MCLWLSVCTYTFDVWPSFLIDGSSLKKHRKGMDRKDYTCSMKTSCQYRISCLADISTEEVCRPLLGNCRWNVKTTYSYWQKQMLNWLFRCNFGFLHWIWTFWYDSGDIWYPKWSSPFTEKCTFSLTHLAVPILWTFAILLPQVVFHSCQIKSGCSLPGCCFWFCQTLERNCHWMSLSMNFVSPDE